MTSKEKLINFNEKFGVLKGEFFKLGDKHRELYQTVVKLEKAKQNDGVTETESPRKVLNIIQYNKQMIELQDESFVKASHIVEHLKTTKKDFETLNPKNQKFINFLDEQIKIWEAGLEKIGEPNGDYVFDISEFDDDGNSKFDFE